MSNRTNPQVIIEQFELIEASTRRAKLIFETEMQDNLEVLNVAIYEMLKVKQQADNLIETLSGQLTVGESHNLHQLNERRQQIEVSGGVKLIVKI